jgi:hypothetical protein
MKWFVADAHPRVEPKASRHLANEGFALYLPCYLKRRCHVGRKDWVDSTFFLSALCLGRC